MASLNHTNAIIFDLWVEAKLLSTGEPEFRGPDYNSGAAFFVIVDSIEFHLSTLSTHGSYPDYDALSHK